MTRGRRMAAPAYWREDASLVAGRRRLVQRFVETDHMMDGNPAARPMHGGHLESLASRSCPGTMTVWTQKINSALTGE